MYGPRLSRFRASLSSTGVDTILVTDPLNIYYLTGFTGAFDGDPFFLFVSPSEALLIVDFRYAAQAKAESSVPTAEWKDRTLKGLASFLPEGTKRMGFEAESLAVARLESLTEAFSGVEMTPTEGAVRALRMIKDQVEVDSIAAAAVLGDAAFDHALGLIEPGVVEREIALEIEYHMRKRGAEKEGFQTIVASGKRSALPHGRAGTKPLSVGDLITIDLGARFEGYCSDMTRTVVLGKASEEQRKVYDLVLKAQSLALEAVKPGAPCKEVDSIARSFIEEAGYGRYFGHGLGHGVGLEVHERPALSPKSEDVLAEGMVVTVEPGVYIEDFGGVRIEDLVLVTEEGKKILSHSPKMLIEL